MAIFLYLYFCFIRGEEGAGKKLLFTAISSFVVLSIKKWINLIPRMQPAKSALGTRLEVNHTD